MGGKEFVGALIGFGTFAIYLLAWAFTLGTPLYLMWLVGQSVWPIQTIGAVLGLTINVSGLVYLSRKHGGIDAVLGKILTYGLKQAESFYGPVHRERWRAKIKGPDPE